MSAAATSALALFSQPLAPMQPQPHLDENLDFRGLFCISARTVPTTVPVAALADSEAVILRIGRQTAPSDVGVELMMGPRPARHESSGTAPQLQGIQVQRGVPSQSVSHSRAASYPGWYASMRPLIAVPP